MNKEFSALVGMSEDDYNVSNRALRSGVLELRELQRRRAKLLRGGLTIEGLGDEVDALITRVANRCRVSGPHRQLFTYALRRTETFGTFLGSDVKAQRVAGESGQALTVEFTDRGSAHGSGPSIQLAFGDSLDEGPNGDLLLRSIPALELLFEKE